MKKEISELLKKAAEMQTAEDIRKEIDRQKNRFCETLNKEQQINFKIICRYYEKLMELETNDAFHNGAYSALTTNGEEDYLNFIKEQSK